MLVACSSPGPIFGQLRTIDELAKYSPNQNAAIAVGKGLNGIGVGEIQHKVYVANSRDNTVSVINSTNDKKIGNDIQLGSSPNGIGVDSSGGKVYVANSGDNTISVIDEATTNPHAGRVRCC